MTREHGATRQDPEPNFEQRSVYSRFKDHLIRERRILEQERSRRLRLPIVGVALGGATALTAEVITLWNATEHPRTQINELYMNGGTVALVIGGTVAGVSFLRGRKIEKEYRDRDFDNMIELRVKVRMLEEGKIPFDQNPEQER